MRGVRELNQLAIRGKRLHHSLYDGKTITAAQIANRQAGYERIYMRDALVAKDRLGMRRVTATDSHMRKALF